MSNHPHIPAAAACSYGPSAVSGKRCGEPAVFSFVGSDGEVYYECAAHSSAHVVPRAGNAAHAVGEAVMVHRHGKDYRAVVSRVGARGAVYARFVYDNGAVREIRVDS